MLTCTIRRSLCIVALGALPALAAAQGSQAGDNGRLPVGADNDSPRQAIPNAVTNEGTPYRYDRRYYDEDHGYRRDEDERSLLACERRPLAERPACRDAVYGRHDLKDLAQRCPPRSSDTGFAAVLPENPAQVLSETVRHVPVA